MNSALKFRWKSTALQAFLIVFAIVQLYPLVWLVLTSFKTNLEITGSNVIGIPAKWMVENYKYVWG